ncbi:MAG: hypothetical protein EXS08_07470 [Planctomycetes bacterium]|nr:hypothetical protein [Planctomycetota bacterium]
MRLGHLLLTLLLCASAAAARGDEELERLVRALDSAREPEWTQAFERLRALGAPAAERVLGDFTAVDFGARRARAKLLLQLAAPAQCAPVLALLADPDPQVRRLLALFLGSPALAEAEAAARVAALERLALDDPNDYVRIKAREALAECSLAEAVPALDRALDVLPPSEAEPAAKAFAQLPLARERLIARVTAAFAPRAALAPPADPVLAALLRAYGRALAEVPHGGEDVRERRPFVLALTHPASELQEAARYALAGFVARAAELSEGLRADAVLARLADEGWPRVECLRQRLTLAWMERGDAQAALSLSEELARAAASLPSAPELRESWGRRAELYRGAALFVLDRKAEAATCFDTLVTVLDGQRAQRDDLFPSAHVSDRQPPEVEARGGTPYYDRLHLLALVHLWRALLALAPGADDTRALEELREAHLLLLESRVVALRTDAPDAPRLDGLDDLLDRDLSPYTLVLFNQKLLPQRRVATLDQALALSSALGRVAPLEMLGLEGPTPARRELGDVFFDVARRTQLMHLRTAYREQFRREKARLADAPQFRDPDKRQERETLYDRLIYDYLKGERDESDALQGKDPARLSSDELRTIYAQLVEQFTPSLHAQALASELRAEGRTAEARALCERALATLRTAPIGSGLFNEYSSAQFELLRGSTFTDENRPQEAEQAYLEGEKRLSAIEQRIADMRSASAEPEAASQIEGQLRMVRAKRGDALLSLAVNANVRMGDKARALEYFERAYALDQSSAMRVLRACYRARSGKVDEARTILRGVVPVPSLYYNIACTYALLGAKEPALDYLERDFHENHPTPGALAQRREWARKDPDLAPLRADPRFLRLLGAE